MESWELRLTNFKVGLEYLEFKLENVTNRGVIHKSKMTNNQRLFRQREKDRIMRLDFIAVLVISFNKPINRIYPNMIVSGES